MKRSAPAISAVRPICAAALAALLISLCATMPSSAADLAFGKQVFAKCRICHTVMAAAPSTVGPNLHGIFARKAGSLGDFAYSPAMKASGITWNEDTLAKYLRDPKAFIPGNKMAFPGIKDEKTLADLIAYLKQVAK